MCSVRVTADGSRTQTHWRSRLCMSVHTPYPNVLCSADIHVRLVLWHPLKSLSDLIYRLHHLFSIISSVHQYLLCSSVAVTITSIQILMASALWATRKKSRSYVFTQKVRLGRGDWEWQKHSQHGKYRNVSETLLNCGFTKYVVRVRVTVLCLSFQIVVIFYFIWGGVWTHCWSCS